MRPVLPLPLLLTIALGAAPDALETCLDQLHGIGRARDLPAARACLAAALPSPCPDSGSPDLARAELAVMYLDGQGGPADPQKAWELLRGCFEDATVLGLQEAFEGRKPTGKYDFCRELGGTTFTINECSALEVRAQDQGHAAAATRLRAQLPAAARARLDAAEKVWAAFVQAAAEVAADEVRGGTAATSYRLSTQADLGRARARWLEELPALQPQRCDARALEVEDGRLNAAYQAARKELDEDGARLLRDAERAWIASRDADAALASVWKGPELETAVRCLATQSRARALQASGTAGR
jgi:uncharacterized protein YecT (DUF1311 family)